MSGRRGSAAPWRPGRGARDTGRGSDLTPATSAGKIPQSNQTKRSRNWLAIRELSFCPICREMSERGRNAALPSPSFPLLAATLPGDPHPFFRRTDNRIVPIPARGRIGPPEGVSARDVEAPAGQGRNLPGSRLENGSARARRPACLGRPVERNARPVGGRLSLPARGDQGGAPTAKACSTVFRIVGGVSKEVRVA